MAGHRPTGSQRDPVNRRVPPRTLSRTVAKPNAATPASANPPDASTVRRETPFRGGGATTRHRCGNRWTPITGTSTRPSQAWSVRTVHEPDRQQLAPGHPQEPAGQRAGDQQRDGCGECEASPSTRLDRSRHRSPQFPDRGRDERATQQPVQGEYPARLRVAGLERQQPGRADADDEERQHAVERRVTHDGRSLRPARRQVDDSGTIPVMPDDITLRNPRPDELHDYWRPLADAFSESLTKEEIEAERPLIDFDRFIGAFDGEVRVGTAGAYTFRMTVPGGEVGAPGITGVGVRPDYRRRGILRQMMDWLLDDARRRGEPVAILTATEAAIYQRFGFGPASSTSSFTLERAASEFREPVDLGPGAQIRMVDTDEATRLFSAIYDRVRPGIPGAVDRIEPKWRLWLVADAEWMRRGDGIKYQAVIEVDGEPRGYAIYRIENGWGPTGPASTMNVLEVTGVDPVAEQALWQWLLSMDLVRTVAGRRGPVPHPLQSWLLEPRRLALTIVDGLWLRILDLPAALTARQLRRVRLARAGRGGRHVRLERGPMAAIRFGWARGGFADEGRAGPGAGHRDAGGGVPRRVPVRGSGRCGPGPRMPARRPPDRGRAVHPAACPLELDAVLGDRRSRRI